MREIDVVTLFNYCGCQPKPIPPGDPPPDD
jgi:hypothetical protein